MSAQWKFGRAVVGDLAAWSNLQADEGTLSVLYHGLAHVATAGQAASHLGQAVGQKLKGNDEAAKAQLNKAKKAGVSSLKHVVKGAANLVPGGAVVANKAVGEARYRKWSKGQKNP